MGGIGVAPGDPQDGISIGGTGSGRIVVMVTPCRRCARLYPGRCVGLFIGARLICRTGSRSLSHSDISVCEN